MSDVETRALERAAETGGETERRRFAVARFRASGDCGLALCDRDGCPSCVGPRNKATALRLFKGRRARLLIDPPACARPARLTTRNYSCLCAPCREKEGVFWLFDDDEFRRRGPHRRLQREILTRLGDLCGREVAWLQHVDYGTFVLRFDRRPDEAVADMEEIGDVETGDSLYSWTVTKRLCPDCLGRAAREHGPHAVGCKTCGTTGRAP